MTKQRPFIPRPEAHEISPGKPLKPVDQAVGELLTAIDGTIRSSNRPVAHCFVVAGERGTGKTTVLMTAKARCDRGKPGEDAEPWRDLARRVRWLDILDVEPLQPSSNLLTILLVAIAKTIDDVDGRRRVSLLEDQGSARGALDALINQSALIWEGIQENSTREIAHRQIAVGETYLEFSKKLPSAIEAAGKELARHDRDGDEPYVFIAPIDNVDRSADHLKKIFKLVQLVNCEHLCLVFAADRAELSVFLERAYWNEATSGSPLPKFVREEDEALSLARRQAAATLRKTLPPINRIEIKLIGGAAALDFSNSLDEPLRGLFSRLPIEGQALAMLDARGDEQPTWEPRHLLELFEFDRALLPAAPQSSGGRLTELGREALQLPARGLLDLWLLARSEVQGVEREGRSILHAIRVVRAMLRLAVAESKLPHWAVDLMQESVITRTVEDETRFVLAPRDENPYVEVRRFRSLDAVHTLAGHPGQHLDEAVVVRTYTRHEFTMTICGVEGSATVGQPMLAWFLLLHDLLILAPELFVINSPPDFLQGCAPMIETHRKAWFEDRPILLTSRWPVPRWATVYDCVIMEAAWQQRLERLEHVGAAKCVKALALSWIELVLWIGSGVRTPWRAEFTDPGPTLVQRLAELRRPDSEFGPDSSFWPRTGSDYRRQAFAAWVRDELPRFTTGELGVRLELPGVDARACQRSEHALRRQVADALHEALAGSAYEPPQAESRAWVQQVVAEILSEAPATRPES